MSAHDLEPRLDLRALSEWLLRQASQGVLPWGPDALGRLEVGDLVGLRLVGHDWPPALDHQFQRDRQDSMARAGTTGCTVLLFADAMHHYIGDAVPLPAGWAPTRVALRRVLKPLFDGDCLLCPNGRRRWQSAVSLKLPRIGRVSVYPMTERILFVTAGAAMKGTQ